MTFAKRSSPPSLSRDPSAGGHLPPQIDQLNAGSLAVFQLRCRRLQAVMRAYTNHVVLVLRNVLCSLFPRNTDTPAQSNTHDYTKMSPNPSSTGSSVRLPRVIPDDTCCNKKAIMSDFEKKKKTNSDRPSMSVLILNSVPWWQWAVADAVHMAKPLQTVKSRVRDLNANHVDSCLLDLPCLADGLQPPISASSARLARPASKC